MHPHRTSALYASLAFGDLRGSQSVGLGSSRRFRSSDSCLSSARPMRSTPTRRRAITGCTRPDGLKPCHLWRPTQWDCPDQAIRWSQRAIGAAHEHAPVADESARTPCHARDHVPDLLLHMDEPLRAMTGLPFVRNPSLRARTPRQRSARAAQETVSGRALAPTAAPARREEARRQLGRPLFRRGSQRAAGSIVRQTWSRVLGSR
jgi:hypothetical protein